MATAVTDISARPISAAGEIVASGIFAIKTHFGLISL